MFGSSVTEGLTWTHARYNTSDLSSQLCSPSLKPRKEEEYNEKKSQAVCCMKKLKRKKKVDIFGFYFLLKMMTLTF